MFFPFAADVVASNPSPPAAVAPAPTLERAPERPARGEVGASYGIGGGASNWSGDGVGYAILTIGFRLFGTVTPYVGAALGYGAVDERLLTRLTVGADLGHTFGRWRPHVHIGFVHQHEESLAAVAQQPFGAVLGIGVGIRHRAGLHTGIGLDYVFRRRHNYDFSVGGEVTFTWFDPQYSVGPDFFIVADANIAAHFRLF